MGVGALSIPSNAGYAGVGPNFLPWLVAVALLLCGGFMVYEARTGGFRDMEAADEAHGPQPYWPGFVWMSAGLLANAAFITTIGFILSCALCFACAAHGLRQSNASPSQVGQLLSMRSWVIDIVLGLAIAAPVFWMFTKFLAISLPGLTQSGWL